MAMRMVLRLPLRSPETAPISLEEFHRSFVGAGVLQRPAHFRQNRELDGRMITDVVGLAVSGGVDSMALALLCSALAACNDHLTNLRLRAFVVDHGVRAGSSVEAESVSKVLQDRGIVTNILKIQWPKSLSEISNFESLARKYRFQALGNSCRNCNINSLLLAHHQDDQAETVLMRLAAGHRAAGLGGMKSKSEIPECWGIHGVHQSGHWDSGGSTLGEWDKPQSSCRKMGSITGEPMRLELGGVQVYRPLLSFSKERLMATCVKGGMPWFEDSTNTDPTLTPRNAVRYIFKAYTLPSALQKPALLALSCRLQERRYIIEREAYDMLRRSGAGGFDTRAGTLVIRFAKPLVDSIPLDIKDEKLSLDSQRQIARLALQLAIECVTPEERVSIKGKGYAERAVFPSLYSQGSLQQEPLEARNFSIASVKFTRLVQQHLTDPDHKQISEQECGRSPRSYLDSTFLDGHTWLISRQPYPSLETDRPRLVFQPTNSLPSQRSPTWALYDGRYWIRVINHTPRPLHVRPFCPRDMQLLRQTLRGKHPAIWTQLIGLLKKAAPGNIRFTLPVIVETTTVPGSDSQCPNTTSGTERIVALPTLPITLPNQDQNLDFEIRYKKIPEPVREWYEEFSAGRGEGVRLAWPESRPTGRKKQEQELTPR